MRLASGVAAAIVLVASGITGQTVRAAEIDEPKYIRVCEKSPCSGANILRLRFEPVYLHGVLPNEWPCSWNAASVKAGAVAARTYAWWRVEHPRSPDFDIYGSSLDQNYKPGSAHPTCDARIEATAGTRVEYKGKRAFAAYRAETGDPTADGGKPYLVPVRDRHSSVSTIGPGVCQHGSQKMASAGSSYGAILTHYYTGVNVARGAYYFVRETYTCGLHGRVRIETWVDPSDDSTFTRTYPMGACPV